MNPSPVEQARKEMNRRRRAFVKPGGVEKLLAQGRTLRFFGVICQISPEGVQPGDVGVQVTSDDIILEYFSADGQISRGRETSVFFKNAQEAREVQDRVDRVLLLNPPESTDHPNVKA